MIRYIFQVRNYFYSGGNIKWLNGFVRFADMYTKEMNHQQNVLYVMYRVHSSIRLKVNLHLLQNMSSVFMHLQLRTTLIFLMRTRNTSSNSLRLILKESALRLVCTFAWLVLLIERDIQKSDYIGKRQLLKRLSMQLSSQSSSAKILNPI